MSNGSIVADKVILSKVFSEDFWFIVPEYQRSYVWQSDNIIELLDDLYYDYGLLKRSIHLTNIMK